MRQLFPAIGGIEGAPAADVDPAALYGADPRPAPPGRPWVMINMVASLDGATTVGGVSGPLGGPADRAVFSAIRGAADVILVGAGTVRAERYGPPRSSTAQRERRRAKGRADTPRLCVCSASLALDPSASLFADAEPGARPMIVTVAAADAGRRAALAAVADLVVAGEERVDIARALAVLRAEGAEVVLAEGGPSFNGQLVAADTVDELCLTLTPLLVAGRSARIATSDTAPHPIGLSLQRLLEAQGLLFARYARPVPSDDPSTPV